MIESWRLLNTGCSDGAMNMAIDEAMLTLHLQGKAPPTLRFYSWQPGCLSIGAFQSVRRHVDDAECRRRGLDLVRRPTGGRAVLHAVEVTYSLVTSPGYALSDGSVRESYRAISSAIAAGLRLMGLDPQLAPRQRRDERRRSTLEDGPNWGHTPACFDMPSDHELIVGARKLVGSAQLRRGGALLQHGSILLDVDLDTLLAVLRVDNGQFGRASSESLALSLSTRVVGLREVLGREVGFDEVTEAIACGFQDTLGLTFASGSPSEEETALACDLRERKYASDQWNYRR